jgi:peptidoglycan/LPS O-acetylase OafA/YrhL
VSSNELLALGLLAVACLFAAGILLRSWRLRRTRPPLIGAIAVLAMGAVAFTLAVAGVPYKPVVGSAFIGAMVAVLASARMERRTR